MATLSENHKRALLSRLRRIDNLIRDIASHVHPDKIELVFEDNIFDLTCEKRRIVIDWISEVRQLLISIIDRQGLVVAPSTAGTAWLIQTSVDLMFSIVDELQPYYMRGYGELSDEACRELDGIISDLRTTAKLNAKF